MVLIWFEGLGPIGFYVSAYPLQLTQAAWIKPDGKTLTRGELPETKDYTLMCKLLYYIGYLWCT